MVAFFATFFATFLVAFFVAFFATFFAAFAIRPTLQTIATLIKTIENQKQVVDEIKYYENIWYRVNQNGKITDSLKFQYNSDNDSIKYNFKEEVYSHWVKNYNKQTMPKLKEVDYEYSTYFIDTNPNIVKREYVFKNEWIGYSFWNLGRTFSYGSGNGSGGGGWFGTSYYSINMPQKKIYFKSQVRIDNYPDEYVRDNESYFIYQPKNGKYVLFKNTQADYCYLIRPK